MSNTGMGEGVCLQDRYVCLALYGRCLCLCTRKMSTGELGSGKTWSKLQH